MNATLLQRTPKRATRSLLAAAALALAGPALVTPALAQVPRLAFTSPQVRGADVDPADALPPDAELPNAAAAPQIDRFSITVGGDGRGGDALLLRVEGTPGARVTVHLPGADHRHIRLTETARGVYSARYTLSRADALRPDADATAYLHSGNQRVDAVLPRPFPG